MARRRGGGELRAAPVHLQSVRIALKRGARDLNHHAQPEANWNIDPRATPQFTFEVVPWSAR